MENEQPAIRTETKYRVSSCYFCNEFLDNNDFKSHLDKCGQALQKCPNNTCLAYIQRKFLEEHLKDCPKKQNGETTGSIPDRDDEFFAIEQNITMLRSALHEEIRQRHRLIVDIGTLRKHFAQDSENHALEYESFHKRIKDLAQECKEVNKWRAELRVLLDRFYQDLEFRNEATLSFEVLFSEKDKTTEKLQSIESEIDNLKIEQDKIQESMSTTSNNNSLDSTYRGFRSLDRPSSIDRCRRCTFLEWKLSEALVELRQMKHTVCESEDRCEKSIKIVNETQKMCAQTRQELANLQTHLAAEKRMRIITNFEGHLVWRIDQFSVRFIDAKENDTVLRSPIFCNTQYGYTLRLDVVPNGLGKWKGRNLLACLTVVNGEWDALLPWPCKLRADIILRNQSHDSSSPSITKTIVAKRQGADYEPSQYIFISHRSVQNADFLKNDTIFFEVFVHDS